MLKRQASPRWFKTWSLILMVLAAFSMAYPAYAGGGGDKGKDKEEDHGPYYVEMDPLFLPIVSEGRSAGLITFIFSLEMADADKRADAELKKPILTDSYIERLYGVLEEQGVVVNGITNVERLKHEIMRSTKKIMGDESIVRVLVQSINVTQTR